MCAEVGTGDCKGENWVCWGNFIWAMLKDSLLTCRNYKCRFGILAWSKVLSLQPHNPQHVTSYVEASCIPPLCYIIEFKMLPLLFVYGPIRTLTLNWYSSQACLCLPVFFPTVTCVFLGLYSKQGYPTNSIQMLVIPFKWVNDKLPFTFSMDLF